MYGNGTIRSRTRIITGLTTAFALVCVSFTATAQSDEIEKLRVEYDQKLKELQENFEKQLDALKEEIKKDASAEVPVAPTVASAPDGNDFRVYWKDGLRLDSYNGDFKLKFGGRIQNDWAFFSEGDEIKASGINSQDGTEFRRARLFIGGIIYDEFEFKAQFDFEDGEADWKDVYIGANAVPIFGQIRIGHIKEPFGLDALTSSKDVSFMERSLPSTFAPFRNTGIAFARSALDKRLAYTAGVFRQTGKFGEGQSDDGDINFTGRVSGVPIWIKEGDRFLHLGGAVSHKSVNGEWNISSPAEAHMAEDLVGAVVMADDVSLYGLEAAYVRGPWSVQGEYMLANVNGLTSADDVNFDGYYLQTSYFLTGEHRSYKLGTGIFEKVKPHRNFGFKEGGGPGAWELAARYSTIDLNDKGIVGGELEDITAGITWYLNPNMKTLLNYVHGELDLGSVDDSVDYIQARFQVTW
ncbi:MAG: porin [Candidatus Hydrogenedentota bacterium]